jgi:hypothetical protein
MHRPSLFLCRLATWGNHGLVTWGCIVRRWRDGEGPDPRSYAMKKVGGRPRVLESYAGKIEML